MNKEQRDSLMYKLVVIERAFKRGREDSAITDLLRVNLKLIDELYDTQQELAELKRATMPTLTITGPTADQPEANKTPVDD